MESISADTKSATTLEENSDDSERIAKKKTKGDEDTSGVLLDLSKIPLELLELILSHLTDPVSQRRLELVKSSSGRLRKNLTLSSKTPRRSSGG